ncbi:MULTISPECIES: carboxymuconolactone decarboxylase family protein [Actinokineospora]|uniref:Alkyl hydroperoxide reductase AhpD n=1 Tax=Actinokineospora fastidiosa TaxID=1816 RepID=A0A918LBS8_9PSEU|nr:MULTISPECIES: carboxymuconolactone decarboxylase family protein [Actinokineospora]UVS79380.1 alkylhydroperoxidase AhpD family core domain protein [Actinokineospora sp. UTMC 2448]GGS28021.1 alkyl hydroperoxide reductase AhpD [Actinokineospora fastidiosa]
MQQRIDVAAHAPEAYRAMLGLEKFMAGSSLPKSTYELVKVRASQINGCAYCVDMHCHDAKAAGETDERLYAVAVWRETPFFTPAERAALAFAEAATRLPDHGHGVPDEVWAEAAEHYDEPTLAALIVAVATINAWNRIAVSSRAIPGSHRK